MIYESLQKRQGAQVIHHCPLDWPKYRQDNCMCLREHLLCGGELGVQYATLKWSRSIPIE